MIRVPTTTFPHLNRETEGSCPPPPPFLTRNVRRRVPTHHCWLSFDATRRGNPPRRVCLFLFNATRRGNTPRRVCLFSFDVTRRENPPHHVCLFLVDMMRRGNPPHRFCLFYSMRRGGRSLPCPTDSCQIPVIPAESGGIQRN